MRRVWILCCVVPVWLGCPGDATQKTQQRLKELKSAQAEKAEKIRKEDEKASAPSTANVEVVKLGPPWEDSAYQELRPDGPCPDNVWALFPGEVPGASKDEKKANEKKRADLAKALRDQTFLIKLRGDDVKLLPYDAPKGEFPIEVSGTIDCTDSFGHVAIAWTAAKSGDPGNSAAKQDADVTQHIWMAPKLTWSLPMGGVSEAKTFESKNRLGLSARVVVKLGKTENDHKLKKVAKVTEKAAGQTIEIGGGTEDWGAGRLVRAELVAVRVATDKEKTSLFEKKP